MEGEDGMLFYGYSAADAASVSLCNVERITDVTESAQRRKQTHKSPKLTHRHVPRQTGTPCPNSAISFAFLSLSLLCLCHFSLPLYPSTVYLHSRLAHSLLRSVLASAFLQISVILSSSLCLPLHLFPPFLRLCPLLFLSLSVSQWVPEPGLALLSVRGPRGKYLPGLSRCVLAAL